MGNLLIAGATTGAGFTPDYSAISTAMQSGLESVASSAMTVISSLVPAAVAVAGAYVVIRVGMRAFRRISGG